MANERLQSAQLLLRALRDNDRNAIAKHSRESGITVTSYLQLAAILRFWQLGMASSYEEAVTLYNKDKDLNDRLAAARKKASDNGATLAKLDRAYVAAKAKRDDEVLGYYRRQIADMQARCEKVERQIQRLKG